MEKDTRPTWNIDHQDLLDEIERMQAAIGKLCHTFEAEVAALEEQERLARNWSNRRASIVGSRDNWTHKMGSAFISAGGEDLTSEAVLGLLMCGPVGMLWLAESATRYPDATLIDHIQNIADDQHRGPFIRELGVYLCWQALSAMYHATVQAFEATDVAKDPHARWRTRPITANQRYLIACILDLLATLGTPVPDPGNIKRGAAHDWIRDHGGNPRFHSPPSWLEPRSA
jgi:hypothetical protein